MISYLRIATTASMLMAGAACAAVGQAPTQVSESQFFGATVNGHTDLEDFNFQSTEWSHLFASMGQPTSDICDPPGGFQSCTVQWSGVTMQLLGDLDVYELLKFTLTGPEAFLDYGGTTVRVGDPISRLEQIFPQAYQNRGSGRVIVVTGEVDAMFFIYNAATQAIEEIRWSRNIT